MALELINLLRPADLANNVGGVQQEILVAPVSWFTTLVDPPTSHTLAGDSAKIAGNHVFSSGKGFIRLEGDYKTNNFEGALTGEFGSNNREYKVKASFHSISAVEAEVTNQLTNADLIILVRNIKPGATEEVIQFGIRTMPAHLSAANDTSGTPSEGKKGVDYEFTARQPLKYFYGGTITLKP